MEYERFTRKSGYFEEMRKKQEIIRMDNTIKEFLHNSFYNNTRVKTIRPELEKKISTGTITSYTAAFILLDKYFNGEVN